jgi:hypothetical protein
MITCDKRYMSPDVLDTGGPRLSITEADTAFLRALDAGTSNRLQPTVEKFLPALSAPTKKWNLQVPNPGKAQIT